METVKRYVTKILFGIMLMSVLFCMKDTDAYAKTKTVTGYATMDYIAEKMLKAAGVKDNMSADKKVKKIYHYMTKKFKHSTKKKGLKVYYNTKKMKAQIKAYQAELKQLEKEGKVKVNKRYKKMLWHMLRRAGDCTHISAMFEILCEHAGVDAGTCRGRYVNRSGKTLRHTWCWAKVNGKKYYYDIDVEIKNYRKGQGDYYWYKKTYKQAKKNHRFGKKK